MSNLLSVKFLRETIGIKFKSLVSKRDLFSEYHRISLIEAESEAGAVARFVSRYITRSPVTGYINDHQAEQVYEAISAKMDSLMEVLLYISKFKDEDNIVLDETSCDAVFADTTSLDITLKNMHEKYGDVQ